MIVVDASIAVDYLLNVDAQAPRIHKRLQDQDVAVPHLFDIEVAQVIRRFARAQQISTHRASVAVATLQKLPFLRYDHTPLLQRIFALRDNLTAYDAAYLALAEALGAILLTRDAAFRAAPSPAAVETWD